MGKLCPNGVRSCGCKTEYAIGTLVIVDGKPGIIDDYDEEDNDYRVSFGPDSFEWVMAGEINLTYDRVCINCGKTISGDGVLTGETKDTIVCEKCYVNLPSNKGRF